MGWPAGCVAKATPTRKADDRLRLICARPGGQCVLMGQEVVEESDPY
jgi:hypothetical protein